MGNNWHTSTIGQSIPTPKIADAARTSLPEIKHIVISWVLFSVLFWIAAGNKPFHLDELYSWVYAERSSFSEIMLFKEFGIGHPPLYHLIQKTVQTVFPEYFPLQVRLANYIIGSLFVVLFVRFFSHYKNMPIFYYGAASSAAVLDTYIFSRMWGLILLMSLLLLQTGERYRRGPTARNLMVFCIVCLLGMLSDYNFILLLPYVVLLLWPQKMNAKTVLIPLLLVWTLSALLSGIIKGFDPYYLFYLIGGAPVRVASEMGQMLFKFWFQEPLLLSLLLVLVSSLLADKIEGVIHTDRHKIRGDIALISLLFVAILIAIDASMRSDFIRLRFAAPLIAMLVAYIAIALKTEMRHFDCRHTETDTLIVAITGAVLILLSANSFFWRDLIDSRFLIVLLPFILMLLYRKLTRTALKVLSLVLMASGLLYVSSSVVSDFIPAPAVRANIPVVFHDIHTYSTQYFMVDKNTSNKPFIIDPSLFRKDCKVCEMGTDKILYAEFNTFMLVGAYNLDPKSVLPPGFVLTETQAGNLTWSDRLQFKYFKSFGAGYYRFYTYTREDMHTVGGKTE